MLKMNCYCLYFIKCLFCLYMLTILNLKKLLLVMINTTCEKFTVIYYSNTIKFAHECEFKT